MTTKTTPGSPRRPRVAMSVTYIHSGNTAHPLGWRSSFADFPAERAAAWLRQYWEHLYALGVREFCLAIPGGHPHGQTHYASDQLGAMNNFYRHHTLNTIRDFIASHAGATWGLYTGFALSTPANTLIVPTRNGAAHLPAAFVDPSKPAGLAALDNILHELQTAGASFVVFDFAGAEDAWPAYVRAVEYTRLRYPGMRVYGEAFPIFDDGERWRIKDSMARVGDGWFANSDYLKRYDPQEEWEVDAEWGRFGMLLHESDTTEATIRSRWDAGFEPVDVWGGDYPALIARILAEPEPAPPGPEPCGRCAELEARNAGLVRALADASEQLADVAAALGREAAQGVEPPTPAAARHRLAEAADAGGAGRQTSGDVPPR